MAARIRKPRSFSGKVVRERVASGSKSEHVAICIDLRDRRLKLRRIGGNPFADAELHQLLGKRICVEGELLNPSTVLVSSWRIIEPRPVRRTRQ
jgi:hypothetical protein